MMTHTGMCCSLWLLLFIHTKVGLSPKPALKIHRLHRLSKYSTVEGKGFFWVWGREFLFSIFFFQFGVLIRDLAYDRPVFYH